KWISVGPIEEKFYAQLLRVLEIDPATLGRQLDPEAWPRAKAIFAARFRTKPRDEWARIFAPTDACVAPVLSWDEAPHHEHLAALETFVTVDGIVQPAPAPRFSRTVPDRPVPPKPVSPENTESALASWLTTAEFFAWRAAGVID